MAGTATAENPIRGVRAKAEEAKKAAEAAPKKPAGLRGRKFLAVVAGDQVGDRIPFEVGEPPIPCWVRLHPASQQAFRQFVLTMQDLAGRDDSGSAEDRREYADELTQVEVALAIASLHSCSLAEKISTTAGEVWQAAVPPEDGEREDWLKKKFLAMEPEIWLAFFEEVQAVNGLGAAQGNSTTPSAS